MIVEFDSRHDRLELSQSGYHVTTYCVCVVTRYPNCGRTYHVNQISHWATSQSGDMPNHPSTDTGRVFQIIVQTLKILWN